MIVSHGSAGLFCYDLSGKETWRRDLGEFRHIWGNANSPVIYGDSCIINCGPGVRTHLLCLDKKTGKETWKIPIPGGHEGTGGRESWTGSWSTPLVLDKKLLVSYPGRLIAFEATSGRELWSCSGLGKLVYTSPLAREGVAVSMSGFMGPPLQLLELAPRAPLFRAGSAPELRGRDCRPRLLDGPSSASPAGVLSYLPCCDLHGRATRARNRPWLIKRLSYRTQELMTGLSLSAEAEQRNSPGRHIRIAPELDPTLGDVWTGNIYLDAGNALRLVNDPRKFAILCERTPADVRNDDLPEVADHRQLLAQEAPDPDLL